jgi:hypothetical protein
LRQRSPGRVHLLFEDVREQGVDRKRDSEAPAVDEVLCRREEDVSERELVGEETSSRLERGLDTLDDERDPATAHDVHTQRPASLGAEAEHRIELVRAVALLGYDVFRFARPQPCIAELAVEDDFDAEGTEVLVTGVRHDSLGLAARELVLEGQPIVETVHELDA